MKRNRNGEVWDFEEEMLISPEASDVILGVDGGTSDTVCVCMAMPFSGRLQDPLPLLARSSVAGCSNHNSVGETEARQTLEAVMARVLMKCRSNRSAVRAVCLAVAGVDHPTDQERILNWLRFDSATTVHTLLQQTTNEYSFSLISCLSIPRSFGEDLDRSAAFTLSDGLKTLRLFHCDRDIFPSHVKLFVRNDAVAALASGTLGRLHGCVLIAGTGTIAYGYTEDGREARAAGAGPILGDWGSGYGIAAQALTAVVRAHDGRGPQTMLTRRIMHGLQLSSPDELIGWTYADPSWARIAELVPVVLSCAESGDEVAHKILLYSVQELATSVKAVVQRLGLSGKDGQRSFPLVMVGRVLEANQRWDVGGEVISLISKEYPGVCPVRPKVEPAVGAALLAWNFFVKGFEGNQRN